ncbi:MAG: oligosaccharide flippase family protein [bacterium]|nr:oligosaccharide flippase family protein [bacterium]
MANETDQRRKGGEKQGLGEAKASRLGAAAALLAASVLLSRVIGFFREIVLAAQVGVGSETDSFYAAFLIPDILNYLLAGGALAIAFIPLYNRVRRQGGEGEGDALLATVLGTLGTLTIVLTLLLWAAAPELVSRIYPEFDAASQQLTTKLARIVLPAQIFFVTGGLLRAVLMAHGRFWAQALAPLAYNGATIAGGLLTATVEGFAWGALIGAFIGNWLVPVIAITRVKALRARFAPFDAHFRVYLYLALPLMLGVSLTTVDEWYEKYFGGLLATGTLAQLSFARKLMMAPVAIVGQAVAAAALPVLSQLLADGRESELNETLERTLVNSLGIALLATGGFAVFAYPIVEILYQRGRFDAEATLAVGALLGILALAVPGWVTQQIAVRAFYAREQMWRPMGLGTLIALAAIPLYFVLARGAGAAGLAWAGVIAISVNAAATLVWAQVRFGGPSLVSFLETFLRSGGVALASAVAGGAAVEHLASDLAAVLELAIGGAVYLAVALALGWVVGEAAVCNVVFARWRRSAGSDS